MAGAMATTALTHLPQTVSSCSFMKQRFVACSAPALPRATVSGVQIGLCIPRPSFRHLCTWSGLKHLGISCRHRNRNRGNKERYIGRIYASLFGVGAPEALVIGVVALLVFGPKGLAEVARNLGQTLRAFQPTIKELQDVSREFKSTLEKEIGLDEISRPANNAAYRSAVFDPQAGPDPSATPILNADENRKWMLDGSPSTRPASAESDSAPSAEPQGVPNTTSTSGSSGSGENSQDEREKS